MKDITITVPGFRVSIPKEKLNVHTLEEMALELTREMGKQVMIKTLQEVDDVLMKEREEGLKNQGLRARYLTTRLGDISFKRRAYYDSNKKLRYLLDEDIGLEKNRRVTVQREKIESMLAATGESYRDAQMRCESFFGGSRSHETIRSQVIREGEKIGSALAKSKIEARESSPARDMVIVEVDGTPIHLQSTKKGQRRRQRMAEVRLGVAYTGWERRYRGGSGLLKVGTKIRNGDWDSWWAEERDQPLPEVLTKEEIKRLVPDNLRNDSLWDGPDEADVPILRGPFQGYPYVESIRELVGLAKVR